MQRRPFLSSLIGLALSLALASTCSAAPDRTKLVFHVNDDSPEHQEAVLRNLHNHVSSVGADRLDVIVLLQGGGVSMLLRPQALTRVQGLSHANAGPDFQARIDQLRNDGVMFAVSGRTLVKHHIDLGRDLYNVHPRDVVPNALSYLADLENRGYTYIKP